MYLTTRDAPWSSPPLTRPSRHDQHDALNKHRESHPLISDYAASSVLTGSMHTCTPQTSNCLRPYPHGNLGTNMCTYCT